MLGCASGWASGWRGAPPGAPALTWSVATHYSQWTGWAAAEWALEPASKSGVFAPAATLPASSPRLPHAPGQVCVTGGARARGRWQDQEGPSVSWPLRLPGPPNPLSWRLSALKKRKEQCGGPPLPGTQLQQLRFCQCCLTSHTHTLSTFKNPRHHAISLECPSLHLTKTSVSTPPFFLSHLKNPMASYQD